MTRRVLVPGSARGEVLVLDEPLSLWGGVDSTTGTIVEAGHPQFGSSVRSRILVMPHGRGSSSSSYVLAELLRIGNGPAAIILREPDSILVVGVLVARMLYEANCPVLVDTSDFIPYTMLSVDEFWLEKRPGNADN